MTSEDCQLHSKECVLGEQERCVCKEKDFILKQDKRIYILINCSGASVRLHNIAILEIIFPGVDT